LPNMTAATVDFAVASNMGGQEPMHPTAQSAVMFGPKSQVKMVGHQTVGENAHADPSSRLADQPDEGMEISLAMKYFRAPVAAIENMVTETALGTSRRTWHASYCHPL